MSTTTSTTPDRSALVVGATGHVGSQVVRLLAERDWHVRALVRSSGQRVHDTDGLPVSHVHGDLRDAASIDAAVEGVDAVVSTANGIIPTSRGAGVSATNDLVGDVLVDAAVRHRVGRYVQASVPLHEPSLARVEELASKRGVELALEASPLDYVVQRNPAFMDVWLVMLGLQQAEHGDPHATTRRDYGFMRAYRRITGDLATAHGRLLAPGGAEHGSALVATRDVARGLAAAVEADGLHRTTIEFGGPAWLTWREVAAIVSRQLGREVRPTRMPAGLLEAARRAVRPFDATAANVLALTGFVASHQPRWDDAAIVDRLGLSPRTTVSQYLDRHLPHAVRR